MNSTTQIVPDSITQFKTGVDSLLEKRDYFIMKILPKLIENRDYYVIKGRKSLGKAGAEKLATIYSLVATFTRDNETLESFKSIDGLVAYVCTLTHSGEVVGQGRGGAVLQSNGNDANKTIKMAQKSGFIDAVIRATGLSDIFTCDLEDMPLESIQGGAEAIDAISPKEKKLLSELTEDSDNYLPRSQDEDPDSITPKQKKLLTELIFERVGDKHEREQWLSEIDSFSKFDASQKISGFLI